LLQRLALVVSHGEKHLLVLGLTNLVDRADVGVVECGGRFGLVHKPLAGSLAFERVQGKELQRDDAIEQGILGLEDLPIPPSPILSRIL
jgi:hypothetical protein